MFEAQSRPRAFFGGALEGTAPVRYIYVDEAGTSVREPVTIVAGIVVHADRHWKLAADRLAGILKTVPEVLHPGFISHAKTVWGSHKYRDSWSLESRLEFLDAIMSLPRLLGIPVSLGVVRRDSYATDTIGNMSREQYQHALAFILCLSQADQYMRDHAGAEEVATVVAENIPEMHSFLRFVTGLFRTPRTIPQHMLSAAYPNQDGVIGITRVVDTIHFVEKADSPFLQIADACAFGFRRHFAGESFGKEFVRSIIGSSVIPTFREDGIGGALFRDI